MTVETKSLLNICEVLRNLIEIQQSTQRSFRAAFAALKAELPDLEARYQEARTDTLFATSGSAELSKLDQQILTIAELLKRNESL